MIYNVIQSLMHSICRSLPCELASPLPLEVRFLLQDFRLMVYRGIRFALENDLTAKGSLVKFAQSMAKEYHINFQHARTASEVALSLGKGHRRRLRKGKECKVPYVYRPFLRADDLTFHLSTESGHVRLHSVSPRSPRGSTNRHVILVRDNPTGKAEVLPPFNQRQDSSFSEPLERRLAGPAHRTYPILW